MLSSRFSTCKLRHIDDAVGNEAANIFIMEDADDRGAGLLLLFDEPNDNGAVGRIERRSRLVEQQ